MPLFTCMDSAASFSALEVLMEDLDASDYHSGLLGSFNRLDHHTTADLIDMAANLPQSNTYVQSVRESCKALRMASGVRISPEAIQRFLLSQAFAESFERLQTSHGVSMPLNFPNVAAELNLISILALLNFASGYRVPLHEATGRGAYDNIRALLFSLYLTSTEGFGPDNLLSAKGMAHISREKIAELMNISIRQEKSVPGMPGVVMSEVGGPLLELVELISYTMNSTGRILLTGGYPDLGAFVFAALNEAKRATEAGPLVSPELILEKLVKAFPAFQDMAMVDGRPVYVFKKALFLIHAIVLRFGKSKKVPIPDTTTLPVFADNVLPSMLVHLGVIDLTECTVASLRDVFSSSKALLDTFLSNELIPGDSGADSKKGLPKEGPHLSKEEAYILRASAVDACELIVKAAHTIEVPGDETKQAWLRNINLPQLDGWLWAVAKDRLDYRRLERFVETSTVFY